MNRLKALLLSLCCLSLLPAAGQHYVGVRGGWGGGSGRFLPKQEMGYEWGLPAFGVSYKFFSDVKYVGAIEMDLLYARKGFNYDLAFLSDSSYHRTLNSVELPLFWQPHVYLFRQKARFFLNLGIQLSYNLNSKYYRKSKQAGIYEQGNYPMMLTRDNRLGYGLVGGAGLSILAGSRFEVTVEARYTYGFSDVLRNSTKSAGNPLRSPLDNITIFAGLNYRLGRDGRLRSAPVLRPRPQESLDITTK